MCVCVGGGRVRVWRRSVRTCPRGPRTPRKHKDEQRSRTLKPPCSLSMTKSPTSVNQRLCVCVWGGGRVRVP